MEIVEQLVGQGAALVLNHSGGKDSSAMLAYVSKRFPDAKKYVVFADTGFEHIKPVRAEEWARRIAARYGLELSVARNPNKNLLTMILKRGKFPSPSCRQCTSDLKRDPISTWIRQNVPERVVINCMGLRSEESTKRARAAPFRIAKRMTNSVRSVYEWLPIKDWTLTRVLDFHKEENLPLHPVYVWAGGYLKRFSCRLCIMMTNAEIRAVREHDPAAFAAMAGLEEKTGFTMKPGQTLYQICEQN